MSRKTKIWLITAISLIITGGIIFVSVMTIFNWDFRKISTLKFETNSYEIDGEFKDISIITKTADIVFAPSEDSKVSVICYEQEKAKHSVKVIDGTFEIEVKDSRKWYEYLGISFNVPKIILYLPEDTYGSLSVTSDTGYIKIPDNFSFENVSISGSTGSISYYSPVSGNLEIKTSTGSINLGNISSNNVELSVSTGRINVSDLKCKDIRINVTTGDASISNIKCENFISNGNTGDITFENVIVIERLSAQRSTGDITFKACDAGKIFMQTDTGDVKGSLLTNKVFITETDTGFIDVPKSVTGGICEIITDTGDIKIKVIG